MKCLICKYRKKCACGRLYASFSSANEGNWLFIYRSAKLIRPLFFHIVKTGSDWDGMKLWLKHMGECKDTSGAESTLLICFRIFREFMTTKLSPNSWSEWSLAENRRAEREERDTAWDSI